MAGPLLGSAFLLTLMGIVTSQEARADSLSVGGGTLSWNTSSSTSGCSQYGATVTVYTYVSFSFTSASGVVTPFSGTGASYYQWNGSCVPTEPQGALPASIALDGPAFGITFYPSNGSGSASYTSNSSAPTLSVETSGTPSTYGGTVTFTATISSGPTGTVTFYDSGTSIGTGTIIGSAATFTTSALTPGAHTITASWAGNTNYNSVASAAIAQTVNKAPLIVTANNAIRIYGVPNPEFTVGYSGFVNGDTSTVLSGAPSLTTAAVISSPIGTYSILPGPGTLSATNYIFSYVNGTLGVVQNAIVFPAAGKINTVAGNGKCCVLGDGGLATNGGTRNPFGVAIDTAGNLYIADNNENRVRKVTATTGVISTVAGGGTVCAQATDSVGDGCPATGSTLNQPSGIAVDSFGNIYVSDTMNHRVREVNAATGIITTIVGDGNAVAGGPPASGVLAINAEVGWPSGLVLDTSGNLYFSDGEDSTVREVSATNGTITPDSIITTVAGAGFYGPSSDGGLATKSALMAPSGIALDSSGNVYVADKYSNRVRKITQSTGIISTVAGTSGQTAGYTGDGGLATSAELNQPTGIAIDMNGDLYIADSLNCVVRRVRAATGYISTVAGNATCGYSGDGGLATVAELNKPLGVALDPFGNLYVADEFNFRIRAVEPGMVTPTIAWIAPAPIIYGTPLSATQLNASLSVPGTCVYTPALGAVLAAGTQTLSATCTPTDTADYATPAAMTVSLMVSRAPLTVIAINSSRFYGTANPAFTASYVGLVNGDTPAVLFGAPGLTTTATSSSAIGAYTITTAVGTLSAANYSFFVFVNGTLTITPATEMITWAAPEPIAYSTPLSLTQLDASLNVPGNCVYTPPLGAILAAGARTLSVTCTPTDMTYYSAMTSTVMLTVNPAVLTVTANSATRIYGVSNPAFSASYSGFVNGDTAGVLSGTPSLTTSATSSSPIGTYLITPTTGTLSAANYTFVFNNGMLAVVANAIALPAPGNISTVAGTVTGGFSGDNGRATNAKLAYPKSVAVDSAGNLFIADTKSSRIRMVSALTGDISTVAGNGPAGYGGDGGSATTAELNYPTGIAVDRSGNIYIADTTNNCIRKVTFTNKVITTFAGSCGTTGSFGGDGGPATSASLNDPQGLALDSAGNLYIADLTNQLVRRVNATTGVISTVVGNNTVCCGYSGDGGPATSAHLFNPSSLAFDSSGNLYIADAGNNRIRKVTAPISTGIITTVVGNGVNGYSGDNGPATSATLYYPTGVGVDVSDNIYVFTSRTSSASNQANCGIRKVIAATGKIYTVGGNGTCGYSGDGGMATSAELNAPYSTSVAIDSLGNLYLADANNHRVRAIAPSSNLTPTINWPPPAMLPYGTPLSATQLNAVAGVPANCVYTPASGTVLDVGTQTLSVTCTPTGTTVYSPGVATVALTVNQAPPILAFSAISTQTYGVDPFTVSASSASTGPITYSVTSGPATISGSTVAITGAGSVVLGASQAATANYAAATATISFIVNKATPTVSAWPTASGITLSQTLASSTLVGGTASVDGTFAWTTPTTAPGAGTSLQSVTFTPTFSANYNTVAGSVNVSAVMPTPTLSVATSVTPSTYGASVTFIATISSGPTGSVTFYDGGTDIGTSAIGGSTASFTTSALAAGVHTIWVGYSGNANYNDAISSAITQTVEGIVIPGPGIITTVAGNGISGFSGDGGLATAAELIDPSNLALDAAGNLYIADPNGYRIRKVSSATGIITTVAGNGIAGYSGDGNAATNAKIGYNYGLAVDMSGNVYINDGNCRIRKVAVPSGIISTVAGNGTCGYTGIGGLATKAKIDPSGLAVDASGNLYFANISADTSVMEKVAASTGIISIVPGLAAQTPVVDASGNLFIISGGYIQKVSSTTGAVISTVAGNGTKGHTGDGGPATSAEINVSSLIGFDPSGNIYFWDADDNNIRKVTTSTGVISVVAVVGGGSGCTQQTDSLGDGCLAIDGVINRTLGNHVVDGSGNIYFAEFYNRRVRAVSPIQQTQTQTTTEAVSCSPASLTYGLSSVCNISVSAAASGSVSVAYVNTTANATVFGPTAILTSGTAVIATPSNLGTGTYNIVVTYNGDNTYLPAVATASLTVAPAVVTVAWPAPAAITYGTALGGSQLNAISSVPGVFVYTPNAGTILSVGTHTLSASFSPNDTADYSVPATLSVQITVVQRVPSVAWTQPQSIEYGTPLSSAQLNATANVPGSFSYTWPAGTILPIGVQTLGVVFTPTPSTYNTSNSPISANVQLTVLPDSPTIAEILPNPATAGGTVTIVGQNFGPSQNSGTVTFNGVNASVSAWSDQSITAMIPAVATTGNVVLTVGGVKSNEFLLMLATACAH